MVKNILRGMDPLKVGSVNHLSQEYKLYLCMDINDIVFLHKLKVSLSSHFNLKLRNEKIEVGMKLVLGKGNMATKEHNLTALLAFESIGKMCKYFPCIIESETIDFYRLCELSN